MKIGVNIKVDVTKLDKTRFFAGKKGTYVDLTTFIDTENISEYGDNGIVTQSISKGEREQDVKPPIIGNCKVFYKVDGEESQQPAQQPRQPYTDDEMDQIPF